MESVIKWQTGEPKEEGDYLVSLKNGCVRSDGFGVFGRKKWFVFNSDFILAWCKMSDIEPYKEQEIMYLNEKANKQAEKIEEILEPVKKIMKEIKLDIPDGYEFFGIDDDNKIVLTKKQPQYPKTYEECCDILQLEHTFELKDLTIDEEKLTDSFIRLKRCRDAYWKIAGEELGLDKPWGPDWNKSSFKDVIICRKKNIIKYAYASINAILAFPTAEMRNAFYENFKGLIEDCKELL
jgi:hypothetical protein